MNRTVMLGLLFFGAVIAVLIYSTMHLAKHRVEVCIAYKGRTQCRAASGTSRDFALRSAVNNACAMLASGVTETMSCEHTDPVSVNWSK